MCGSGGSKSRLAKAAGAEPAGQMRDEKLHAVVARSTCPSQNAQSTSASEHFQKLRCRKSARRCGAKHILKSKCTKHTSFGPLLEVEMSKKCTPLWREAHFQVKMYKTPQCRTTLGSCDVEKVHAVVARSTFRSQNVQNTPASDHFWKLRCRKSARRCGAKHISKSKCAKHLSVGRLLEVEMSKKCTPLWREAHFEVKMYKTLHVRATFGGSDVEKVHAVVARTTFGSQNVKNTRDSDHLWRFTCRFASLHYITLHNTPLHNAPLHYTTLHATTTTTTQLHSTTLNYTTLHYITLDYTPLHYITQHYTALPSTTLHYITLHSTTLQLQLHNYTPLQYTPLHSTTLNYTTLHYITLHYTPLHYTTLHYTTFHYTSLHYTTLHYTPVHYSYKYDYNTTLHYTPLHEIIAHYITLHYATFHYTHSLHYITLHYITMTLHRR